MASFHEVIVIAKDKGHKCEVTTLNGIKTQLGKISDISNFHIGFKVNFYPNMRYVQSETSGYEVRWSLVYVKKGQCWKAFMKFQVKSFAIIYMYAKEQHNSTSLMKCFSVIQTFLCISAVLFTLHDPVL